MKLLTKNTELSVRSSDFDKTEQNLFRGLVCERWAHLMKTEPQREAIIHWIAGEEPFRWTWGMLSEAAGNYAAILKKQGVSSGHVCAIIIRHHKDFYPIYLALSSLGALPSVLAYPNSRLHPDKFRHGLEGMAQRSGVDWILTERDLEPILRPLVSNASSSIRGLLFPLEREHCSGSERWSLPTGITSDLPCLLQHSSGTTGLQKAVMLSHDSVLKHVERYAEAIHATREDKVVSWLPLYHDMGLIAAFYVSLTLGIPLVQLDPFEWVSAPVILFEAISRERATLCWMPNFAFNLMAERINPEDLSDTRIDSVRMFVNCSEPVRYDSYERFYDRFGSLGVRKTALTACYAMAETTFAVTQTRPEIETRCVWVGRDDLAQGIVRLLPERSANSRACVSSGAPIRGCELRIVDELGRDLPSEHVGEIVVRSDSLFQGYRNDPEKTEAVLRDGWYYTGDFGFVYEGEYYIVGRKKDIIITAGKNLYPEDIEDVIGQMKDVLSGRVVAFGMEDPRTGTEQICVVVETPLFEAEEAEVKQFRRRVKEVAMAIDVTLARVYLAPPRWLFKSSSGKPSRSANRDRALLELQYH